MRFTGLISFTLACSISSAALAQPTDTETASTASSRTALFSEEVWQKHRDAAKAAITKYAGLQIRHKNLGGTASLTTAVEKPDGLLIETKHQYEAALSEAEKLGDRDVHLLISLRELSSWYSLFMMTNEAEKLLRRAVALDERLDADNEDFWKQKYPKSRQDRSQYLINGDIANKNLAFTNLTGDLDELASTQVLQKQYDDAETCYQRISAIADKKISEEKNQATSQNSNKALKLYYESIYGADTDLSANSLIPYPTMKANALSHLAYCRLVRFRYDQAAVLYSQVLEILDHNPSSTSKLDRVKNLTGLASCQLFSKQYKESAANFRKALDLGQNFKTSSSDFDFIGAESKPAAEGFAVASILQGSYWQAIGILQSFITRKLNDHQILELSVIAHAYDRNPAVAKSLLEQSLYFHDEHNPDCDIAALRKLLDIFISDNRIATTSESIDQTASTLELSIIENTLKNSHERDRWMLNEFPSPEWSSLQIDLSDLLFPRYLALLAKSYQQERLASPVQIPTK